MIVILFKHIYILFGLLLLHFCVAPRFYSYVALRMFKVVSSEQETEEEE